MYLEPALYTPVIRDTCLDDDRPSIASALITDC